MGCNEDVVFVWYEVFVILPHLIEEENPRAINIWPSLNFIDVFLMPWRPI